MEKRSCLRVIIIMAVSFLSAINSFSQFVPGIGGNTLPWKGTPSISAEKFRFVVIGDLTGGEEPGVFASVVKKINDLSPDFVISVGDLIEGYTQDQNTIDRYWKSFQDRVARLNAPFFYVAGNHDISNSLLFKNWMDRFGHDYYSFYIGKSLFIVLSTFEPDVDGLSEEQTSYVKKILDAHDVNYPVYVFSHAPLWERYNEKGYCDLEPVFNRYKTTFFCGHAEHYESRIINDRHYYLMAKSGGGTGELNLDMGYFNHILFCTADTDGVHIANILTDGIIPADVVNDSMIRQTTELRNQKWFSVSPTISDKANDSVFRSEITVTNRGDYPMTVSGKMPQYKGLRLFPEEISEIIPSGKSVKIPVVARVQGEISVYDLPAVIINLKAAFNQNGKEIQYDSEKRWFIDAPSICHSSSEIKTDLFNCDRPAEVEESWCWNGPEDGNFSFSVTYDSKFIFCHIETKDDTLISEPAQTQKPQDRLYFCFSSATTSENVNQICFGILPGVAPVITSRPGIDKKLFSVRCVVKGNSLVADVRFPRTLVKNNTFRLNVGFADLDDRISTDPSILWWRPRWGSETDYPESGTFILR